MVLLAVMSGCGKVEKGSERGARSTAPGTVDAAGIKGIALPVEFPRDVPILRNATLKAAISQGDRIVVHLTTSTSVADAAKFYDAELKSQGWKIESATSGADLFVASARKDRTMCGVTITREGKGALVRLSVSPARS
jgi:hypothetical protein